MLKNIKKIITLYFFKFISLFLAFLAQILLARLLLKIEFGTISFYIILINILASLISFNIGNFLLRQFNVDKSNMRFWFKKSLSVTSFLLIIITPVYFIIPILSLENFSITTALILFPVLIYQALGSILIACYQYFNQLKNLSFYLLQKNSILFLASLLLFFGEFNQFILIYSLLSCLSLIFNIKKILEFYREISLNQIFNSKETPKINEVSFFQFLSMTWPFGIQAFTYMLFYQSPILLITYYLGEYNSALYNSSYTIIALFFTIPSFFFQVYLLPRVHIWRVNKNNQNIEKLLFKLPKYIFSCSLVISGILYLLDEFIFNILYQDKYNESLFLFNILLISIPIRYLAEVYGVLLINKQEMKSKAFIFTIGAFINLVIGSILIMKLELIGIVIAVVISELIVMLLTRRAALKLI